MKDFYPEGIRHKQSFTEEALISLMENDEIAQSPVLLCDAQHNLTVELGCMKGIIEREEGAIGIKEGTTRDIALISRVGKCVSFTVEKITNQNGVKTAVLSRRRAQEKFLTYLKENMTVGDIIDARVTHLDSFGVFCDIGCGVAALLPIDCISVSRISHPADRFFVGQKIRVIIKNIGDDGKITLSHKELLGTWQENADMFTPRQTVSGVVRSVEEYGVFVELAPNLAGLAENFDGVKEGDAVGVYIKSIIPDKMKVKLIIIDKSDTFYTPEIKYFYKDKHIDRFDYSPLLSDKKISTEFKEEE